MNPTLTTLFPGLSASDYRVTSPPTRDYNCIAWAAGDSARWWWPDNDPDNDAVYWPPGVEVAETLDAFVAAVATVGFHPCEHAALEAGIEKIALYAINGIPTHAARQLPNGLWTSKLGMREDIEHEFHAITGETYGQVAIILKRTVS